MEDANLWDESIHPNDYLRVATCAEQGLFSDFCDLDGGQNGLGLFPFVVDVLTERFYLKLENILDKPHFLLSLKIVKRLTLFFLCPCKQKIKTRLDLSLCRYFYCLPRTIFPFTSFLLKIFLQEHDIFCLLHQRHMILPLCLPLHLQQ